MVIDIAEQTARCQRAWHIDRTGIVPESADLIVRWRVDNRAPLFTGDLRRWPDLSFGKVGGAEKVEEFITAAGLRDDDLRAVVAAAAHAWVGVDWTGEQEWVFCNVLDAAIDEQDRRDGVLPRPIARPTPPYHSLETLAAYSVR